MVSFSSYFFFWGSQSFLDLWIYSFHHTWNLFRQYFLRSFFLSTLPSWVPAIHVLGCQMSFHSSLVLRSLRAFFLPLDHCSSAHQVFFSFLVFSLCFICKGEKDDHQGIKQDWQQSLAQSSLQPRLWSQSLGLSLYQLHAPGQVMHCFPHM